MKKCILGALGFAVFATLVHVFGGRLLNGEYMYNSIIQIPAVFVWTGYGYIQGYLSKKREEESKNNKK